jgi:hypothetical protein
MYFSFPQDRIIDILTYAGSGRDIAINYAVLALVSIPLAAKCISRLAPVFVFLLFFQVTCALNCTCFSELLW